MDDNGSAKNNQEINELKTNIALIKKDVSQIEQFFSKIDASIDKISSMSETVAIHDKILTTIEKRLDELQQRSINSSDEEIQFRKDLQEQIRKLQEYNNIEREKYHKEFIDAIKALNSDLVARNNAQDNKIDKLDQWKWWTMGVGAVVVTIGTLLWKSMFGG